MNTTEIESLRAMAIDTYTVHMMHEGAEMSHEQWDSLGADVHGWIGGRLGLRAVETSDGVELLAGV